MQTIERYERYSDGKFYLEETFTTDSPYWRVESGVVYYILWDVIRSVYIEHSKSKMCMSEQEAIENNCGCYYKVKK
jgi:hypothetical protein